MKPNILISSLCFTLLFKEYICIRGGVLARRGEVPYQVAIFRGNKPYCSGSLITEQWVLTAASCVDSRGIGVILGETRIKNSAQQQIEIPPINIIKHPFADKHDNDIALIKLPEKAKLSDNIQTVELPDDDTETYEGATAMVSGWGKTGLLPGESADLMQVSVETMSNYECGLKLFLVYVQETHICTKSNVFIYRGACSGDGGAPLVLRLAKPVQIGVVTKPLLLCTEVLPTLYVRVSKFKTWIESKVNEEQGGE